MGDFNADLLRVKRFDLMLLKFIDNNNLRVVSQSYNPAIFSYF